MPSLSQCTITGSLYDVNGDLVGAGTRVTIVKTVKSGQVIMHTPDVSVTSALGVVTLTAPRASTIYVYAKAVGLEESGPITGVALTVPNAATANLEDLISIASVPSTGLTVKDEGTAFASLVGTFNFVGTGVSAVETSAGLATVTISAGSGVTLREVDGAPSLAATTVEFAQASGFVVTDQTGGVGRVDVLAIPVNKLAALTASRALVSDGSGFLSASGVTTTTLGFLDATSSVQTQLNAKQGTLTNSAGLLAALSDETGTGLAVFNDTPTLVTPALGVASATSINKVAITAPATSATLTIADGKTATISNTLTLTATDASSVAFGAGGTVLYSGGALGTPASGTLTNATGLPPAGIVGWPANAAGVLTNDGAGALSWGAAGGSQTPWTGAIDGDGFALSDVGDLIPRAGSKLGSATLPWLETYTGSTTQYESVVSSAGVITHAALGSATNIAIAMATKGTGSLIVPQGTAANPGLTFNVGGGTDDGLWSRANGLLSISSGGTQYYEFSASYFTIMTGVPLGWAPTSFNIQDVAFFRNGVNKLELTNGTAGQWGSLFCGVRDVGTDTVVSGLVVEHLSTGTPSAKFGIAMLHNLPSSTTTAQAAGQFKTAWAVSTHASRAAWAGIATNKIGSTTLADKLIVGGHTVVATDNTALSLFEVALATLEGCAGRLSYQVFVADGTDSQVRRGIAMFSATQKATVYTSEIVIVSEAASCSAGTLTATLAIVSGASKITVQITPLVIIAASCWDGQKVGLVDGLVVSVI